jgi:hypothetical protein
MLTLPLTKYLFALSVGYGGGSAGDINQRSMADWNVADTTTTLVFERDLRLNRLLVVADVVFAISLTHLAVELALPRVAAGL